MSRASILTFLGVALLASGCSRDPQAGTPEAAAEGDRIVRQMSDTLAQAQAMRFVTDEILEVVEPTGEKRALHFIRKVTVRRPDRLLFELQGTEGTELEAVASYDGRAVSLRGGGRRVWAQAEVPGTIDEMLDDVARRFALPVPVADVIYSVPYDAFLGSHARGGFVGRETIDGVRCVALAYDDDFLEVRLWIPASGRALPRRVRLVYKQAPSLPMAQMTFSDWDLDATVADGTFTFESPEGYQRVAIEEFVAGLLAGGVGDPAPASPGDAGGSAES
jgi:hypothetical protein